MQLVAYGAQDIYLTGNPQITFFKVVYRRHTNFSMEAIEQTWNGTSNADGRCTATISRNGDLVYRMYLEFACGETGDCRVSRNPSSLAIKSVELEIGGQKIDKHTGDWMETWAQLTENNPSGTVSDAGAPGSGTLFQKMSGMGGYDADATSVTSKSFIVPLQFWFCRNAGLALPLIALQYHEVKIILDQRIVTAIKATHIDTKLWADYIYLDTDERRRFAQVSHEYLIEQVQEQAVTGLVNGADLNFNHPVKELIWRAGANSTGLQRGDADLLNVPGTLAGPAYKLKLNGHDRFAARNFTYFTRTQVLQHHSGAGGLDLDASSIKMGLFNDSIGVYSFALKPEEHQPSGTCNFSRIDNAQLESGENDTDALVFAVNYNVLRIMSGMGGLAYSN